MSVPFPQGTSGPRRSSRLAPLLEASRGLGPRHLAASLVVALLLALLRSHYLFSEYTRGHSLLIQVPAYLVTGVALVLGFIVADAYVRHGARPLLAYGTAVFATAVATSVIKWYLTAALGGHNWFDHEAPLAVQRTEMFFISVLLMVQAGFGIAAYLQWRESEATSRLLRASEMQRMKTERHMQQTQLRAMQARVEPELLFSGLQHVGELADGGANERADRLLDELIALLRQLMPGGSPDDRDATTVEHELTTAVAYLRVRDGCVDASREIDVRVAPEAAAQTLPAMLMLPIARAIVRRESAVRAPLRIRADFAEDALTVVFARAEDSSEPLVEQSDLVDLRRRLDRGFGSGAASAIATDSGATLTLHLPLQP
jgi:hypothetical protein